MKELQQNLVDIEVIEEYLKIARSHPILSLSFFKNLKRIDGKRLESNRNALIVWENQNLQELFDENQTIAIGGNGKLFFHFNPKLCFNKIKKLAWQGKILGVFGGKVKMAISEGKIKIFNFFSRFSSSFPQQKSLRHNRKLRHS